jgi:chromosome partitioning protein
MYDSRLNFHRDVLANVTAAYGTSPPALEAFNFKIFDTKIPVSVRVTETQARGQSIFDHDPRGKIAESYAKFTKELIGNGG